MYPCGRLPTFRRRLTQVLRSALLGSGYPAVNFESSPALGFLVSRKSRLCNLALVSDALIAFARRIAAETGRGVPTPNPDGPTTRALALFVLRDPGATKMSGANETGVLDPYLNRDPTSVRQQNALRNANIDPRVCVWWNASPYHLGYKGKIRDGDCVNGARYLREFVQFCPKLRVVVAMGDGAQAVAALAWQGAKTEFPPLILAPHPMIYGRGWAERKADLAEKLLHAARLIRAD